MFKTFDVNDEGSMRLLIVTLLASVFIVARWIINYCMGDKEFNLRLFDDAEEDIRMQRIKTG